MSERALTPGAVTAAAGLATAVAVVAWLGLAHLARPPKIAERVAAAEALIDQARSQSRSRRAQGAVSPHAICPGLTSDDLEAIRRRVSTAASSGALTLSRLSVGGSTARRTDPRLAPVEVTFQASGRYEALVGFLAQLEQQDPQFYVARLDLGATPTGADLKFTGKVYCWDAAAS